MPAAGGDGVWHDLIGTGTGGGIVVNGRLLAGPNRIAGRQGHNPPLPWQQDEELPRPPCNAMKTVWPREHSPTPSTSLTQT